MSSSHLRHEVDFWSKLKHNKQAYNIPGPPSQTIFSNFARVHTYIDWGYLLDIYSNQNSSTIFGIL